MNDHEQGFVGFLAGPSRRRIKTLLELGAKRRRDVRSLLDHTVQLDPDFSHHITGSDAFPGPIEGRLLKLGAPAKCYVLAANIDLDARVMPLRDALDAIIGKGAGAFVSCIPGRLGFYESEGMRSSYLLCR
jgi:hypothetical protein